MIRAIFCKERTIQFDVSELPTTILVEFLQYTKEAKLDNWVEFQLNWFITHPDCPILVG